LKFPKFYLGKMIEEKQRNEGLLSYGSGGLWLGTLLTGGGGHLPSGLSNQARDYGLGIFFVR
jgi:hypothetical protein